MHHYHLAGFVFSCNMEVPDLPETTCRADLTLHVVTNPPDEHGQIGQTDVLDKKWIRLPQNHVGEIYLSGPGSITYVPRPEFSVHEIAEAIHSTLTLAMAAQMGYTVLHAAGIVVNNRCVLLLGKSGSGKSSLAEYFSSQACQLLSDDVSYLKLSPEGKVMVYPAARRIKLSAESLTAFGKTHQHLRLATGTKGKFLVPMPALLSPVAYPLAAAVVLQFADGPYLFEPVTGAQKIEELNLHFHRRKMGMFINSASSRYEMVFSLYNAVPVYQFQRPLNQDHLFKSFQFIAEKLLAIA